MGKFIDLTGQKFNMLTVLSLHHKEKKYKDNKHTGTICYWLCRCDCGNITIVSSQNLKGGQVKSCGCLKHRSYKTTHNLSKSRIYAIWCNMKARCYNKNNNRYKDYGERGIAICDEWKNDFMAFYNWAMSNGYNDTLTIDRIDIDGNYKPSNCRWVDMKAQSNNRRSNHLITYNGETHTISEWADIYNISKNLLGNRIKLGWNIEKALKTPPNEYKNRDKKLIEYMGQLKTKSDWINTLNIHPTTFYRKLKRYKSTVVY